MRSGCHSSGRVRFGHLENDPQGFAIGSGKLKARKQKSSDLPIK